MVYQTREGMAWLCACVSHKRIKKSYYDLFASKSDCRRFFWSSLSRFALERVGVHRWARPACTAATAEEGVTQTHASGCYWYVLIAIHNSGVNGMLRLHDFEVVMPL